MTGDELRRQVDEVSRRHQRLHDGSEACDACLLLAALRTAVWRHWDPFTGAGLPGCDFVAGHASLAAPGLTFAELSRVNRERCEAPDGFDHPLGSWSRSDWFLAAFGEIGEAANKAKKLNRARDGIPGNDETVEELRRGEADEIADGVIYLDLLAQSEGFDLGAIVAAKFNRTSEKIGAPHRLPEEEA